MIKDLATILKLISDLMQLAHPIIQDIRYLFCQRLNDKCWDSREKWNEVVKGWNYSLFKFLKVVITNQRFRKDIIKVLQEEKYRLNR